jgi:hypothetical protein
MSDGMKGEKVRGYWVDEAALLGPDDEREHRLKDINPIQDGPDERPQSGMTHPPVKEPTEPGWYTYNGGAQHMIFLLTRTMGWSSGEVDLRWWVVFDHGSIAGVDWGYIEQALGVWDLVRLVPAYADAGGKEARDDD